MDLLLKNGAEVRDRDSYGRTPLIAAAAEGRLHAIEIAELLIAAGADVNARNNNGRMALREAVLRGDIKMAAFECSTKSAGSIRRCGYWLSA